jgi:thioredoxin 1
MTQSLPVIDNDSFATEVLGSREPFLLVFGAQWCAPCHAVAPVIAEIAREHAGRLRVGKIDTDDAPEIAARFGVRGVPTMILFRDGRELSRHLGAANKRALLAFLGASEQRPMATVG